MVRSALFVPASNERFLNSALRCDADAVILDLEDGVAENSRHNARRLARDFIATHSAHDVRSIFVRLNPLSAGHVGTDLEAVVGEGLDAVLLPKIHEPAEVTELDHQLSWHEGRCGLARGTIRIWPLVETPQAISRIDEIASASGRVSYLGGAISDGGDLVTSLQIEVESTGLASLYLRSRILLAARTAGIDNPITGLFTEIDDLDGLEQMAIAGRRLGYEGMMVIHPSHVPIVNRVFSPSEAAVNEARRVLDALAKADLEGNGAARLDGRMIDVAMARSARVVIERDARAQDRSRPFLNEDR